MKDKIRQIGKQVIYLSIMLILGYAILAFMLWDPNVSLWEIGERAGAIFAAASLIIIERVCYAIKRIAEADDDCDYDDEFLTEEEMEMRMKQEERYNQNQQRHE
jgi:hypothetical protein